jgi:hypothetical protein
VGIELRLGSPDGEKIGYLPVLATGYKFCAFPGTVQAINKSFSGVVVNFPTKTYLANETYCVRAYVEMLYAAPPPTAPSGTICGISYTNGNGNWEWTP